eukprot:gene9809-2134_t
MSHKFKINLSKIKNKSKKNLLEESYSTKSPRLNFYEETLEAGFTPRGDNYVSPDSSPRTSEQTPRSPPLSDRRFMELEVGDEMKTIRKVNRTEFSLKDIQQQRLMDVQKMVEKYETLEQPEETEKPKSARASVSLTQSQSLNIDDIKKAKSFRSPRSFDKNLETITVHLDTEKYGKEIFEEEFSEEEEENLKKLLNLRENKFEGTIFEDDLNIPFLDELENQRKLNTEIKNFSPAKSLKSSRRNSENSLQERDKKNETKLLDEKLQTDLIEGEFDENIKTENEKLDFSKIGGEIPFEKRPVKTHYSNKETKKRFSDDISQFDSPDIISPRIQPLKIPDAHPYSKSMKDISTSDSSKSKNEGVLKKVMQKLNKFGSTSEEVGDYDSDFDDDETPRKVDEVDDLDHKKEPKKKSSMKDLISLAKRDSSKSLTSYDKATKTTTPIDNLIKSGAKSPRRQTIFGGAFRTSNNEITSPTLSVKKTEMINSFEITPATPDKNNEPKSPRRYSQSQRVSTNEDKSVSKKPRKYSLGVKKSISSNEIQEMEEKKPYVKTHKNSIIPNFLTTNKSPTSTSDSELTLKGNNFLVNKNIETEEEVLSVDIDSYKERNRRIPIKDLNLKQNEDNFNIIDKFTFEVMLVNDDLRYAFKKYLDRKCFIYPFLFYEKVSKFKQEKNTDNRVKGGVEILRDFIIQKGQYELNLPQEFKSICLKQFSNLKEYSENSFDDIETIVMHNLKEIYPKFLLSKECSNYFYEFEGICFVNGKYLIQKNLKETFKKVGIANFDEFNSLNTNNVILNEIEHIKTSSRKTITLGILKQQEEEALIQNVAKLKQQMKDNEKPEYFKEFYLEKDLEKLKKIPQLNLDSVQDIEVLINKDSEEEIKYTTIDKLIEKLTSFDELLDLNLLYSFMFTYKTFSTSNEILDKLNLRYNTIPKTEEEFKQFSIFQKKKLHPIRIRITQIIKHWIEKHFIDFDSKLLKRVIEFCNEMKETKSENLAISIEKTIKKMKQKSLSRTLSIYKTNQALNYEKPIIPPNLMNKNGIKTVSNILDWPSKELARQISLIEFNLFKQIHYDEFMNNNWTKENREIRAVNIHSLIEWFNDISSFLSYQILLKERSKARALILSKIIHIANECRHLNNYQATFELISSTTVKSIYRLKRTWKHLSKQDKLLHEELLEYIQPKGNFKFLRNEIKKSIPPCIPYIGLYLKDLIFIEDGNPNFINDKINFTKRTKISNLLKEIHSYQQVPFELMMIRELSDKLVESERVSEETLNLLSYKREPREN